MHPLIIFTNIILGITLLLGIVVEYILYLKYLERLTRRKMLYETWTKGDERVRILWDEDPPNPREWQSDETTMVCAHRRYSLGDRKPESDEEYNERCADENLVVLPLYLYDHSGIKMSTGPFSCPWDSGMVGFIYAEKQGKETEADTTKRLEETVKVYSLYLENEVFCYVRERMKKCDHCGHVKWEHIDSCGGFFGYPDDKNSTLYEDAFPEGREGWATTR